MWLDVMRKQWLIVVLYAWLHCDKLCLFCIKKQTVKKVDAAGMAAACETAAVAGLKGQTVYASQGEAYQTPLQVGAASALLIMCVIL
jgi:hypothetical protein